MLRMAPGFRNFVFALTLIGLLPACPSTHRDAGSPGHEGPRARRRHHRDRGTRSLPQPFSQEVQGTHLKVTFIDVGQGDGALLETSDGHAAMIDTGPPGAREHVLEVLASHRITQLDWLMLSHPHLDHLGDAADVLSAVRVKRVVDPRYPYHMTTYDQLLARIQQLGLPYSRARTGTPLSFSTVASIEILQPHDPFIHNSTSDVNANSVIARVVAGSVRVLFTADAELSTERRLLAENPTQLRSDVLKVAHHGSRYASSLEFLAATAPRYAVVSCGADNEFGHPHGRTLAALSQQNVTLFRTDLMGDVVMSTDGTQLTFRTEREVLPGAVMVPGRPRRP